MSGGMKAALLVSTALVGLAGTTAVPPAMALPTRPTAAEIQVLPTSGPGGTVIGIRGRGFVEFSRGCTDIFFFDANGTETLLARVPAHASFKGRVVIPSAIALGVAKIIADEFAGSIFGCDVGGLPHRASASFTVTP
jgi:hypothetical protein